MRKIKNQLPFSPFRSFNARKNKTVAVLLFKIQISQKEQKKRPKGGKNRKKFKERQKNSRKALDFTALPVILYHNI